MREALSCVDASFDEPLRTLASREPGAFPLGPFAVVDIVLGTDAQEAAARERSDAYGEVRSGLRAAARPAARPASPETPEAPEREAAPPAPPTRARPKATAQRSSSGALQERIRPRKRAASSEPPAPLPLAPVYATAFLPRRALPAPRGRFSRLDPQRAAYEALLRADAGDLVSSLVDQAAHRYALWRTLDQGYTGRRGRALSLEEVVAVLERHKQARRLSAKERESVLGALTEARGSIAKASRILGLRDGELARFITDLRLDREGEELRNRFAREALDAKNLAHRLELVGRQQYLRDLGIETKFDVALARDLRRLLAGEALEGASRAHVAAHIGRREALDPELLSRALQHLHLP